MLTRARSAYEILSKTILHSPSESVHGEMQARNSTSNHILSRYVRMTDRETEKSLVEGERPLN